MASTLPWFMAFEHLPTTSANYALGHEAIASIENIGLGDIGGRRALVSTLTSAGSTVQVAVPQSLTYTVGWYLYMSSSITSPIFRVRGGTSSYLRLDHDGGALKVYDASDVLLGTSSAALGAGAWYYIEAQVTFDASAGTVVLRVNGTEVLSLSGLALPGAAADNVRWERSGVSTEYHGWTNLYIRDEATFYGPIEITLLDLDSDVAVDCTPDSGLTNYTQVQLPAAVASYLDSSTLDDVDENGVEDTAPGLNSIIALVRVSMSEAPDGGAPQIRHGLKRGVTEVYGSERTVGVGGPRSQITVFETQPNGDPWSVTAADEIVSLRKSA